MWKGLNMKLNTTRFGTITVEDVDVITIEDGLFGFPELTRYTLLSYNNDDAFTWLQSLDDGSMAFCLAKPEMFDDSYQPSISEDDAWHIGLVNVSDAVIMIVTTPANKVTGNLMAPVVFNIKTRQGKQVIQRNGKYHTKHILKAA